MALQNDNDEMLLEESYETINLDDLESKLDDEIENSLNELKILKEQKETIENPEALGTVVKDVIWEQFQNQIGIQAGEDFIKENHGNTLDLRDSKHIQTAENFEKGNIATHNYISKESLENNYDRYKNMSHKEFRDNYVDKKMNETLKRAGVLKKEGIDTVTDIYTGRQIPTERNFANGKVNPMSAQREHVKPSAELYKDPSLQMSYGNEELAEVINNPENLQGYTTAERNNRKSDNSANEMENRDKNAHWEKANERAEKYINQKKKDGEQRLLKEGRQTQREETFRIGKTALRAVVLNMLADLVKTIISKLVKWFKTKEKSFKTLLQSLKESIHTFVVGLKEKLISAGNTLITTITTAIFGPIVSIFKKIGILLKQGWTSLKNAVAYLKSPEAKNKPFSLVMLNVGKIVMAGLTALGALVLGEVIEKGLLAIPGAQAVFNFQIPLLGSLANILGIFFGAVVAGIIGAIALNLMDRAIAKKEKDRLQMQMLAKSKVVESANVTKNWIVMGKAYEGFRKSANQQIDNLEKTQSNIESSSKKTDQSLDELDDILSQF